MRLGIDATNARAGGGLTYLVELLRHADPGKFGFKTVVVWAPKDTLSELHDKNWLIKRTHPLVNRAFLSRLIWQLFYLSREAKKHCDILFLPSGNTSGFQPYVSMCQNLLPFERNEKAHYGITLIRLRYELLRWNQCRSFRYAQGVVFLSKYSSEVVEQICGPMKNQSVIPHGVSEIFRSQTNSNSSEDVRVNLLYVSIINFYKHQDKIVHAIYDMLDLGYDITLTLVGPSYQPALSNLIKVINTRPEYKGRVSYLHKIPYTELPKYYRKADIVLFASSCETFGMILLEAMACGSAIACSSLSSMKEIAKDSALYFDPYNKSEIIDALKKYFENPELRERKSKSALSRSQEYSWERCADETYSYLSKVYETYTAS